MVLKDKIIEQRKRAGLSQEQLADILGVTRQSVSKWELGDSVPDVEKILQMSALFAVTTDYLLKGVTPQGYAAAPQAGAPTQKLLLPWTKIGGAVLCVLSFLGIMVLWVLSVAHPCIYNGIDGFRGFLLSYDAVWLFIFVIVLGIAGLYLLSYERLLKWWRPYMDSLKNQPAFTSIPTNDPKE